MADLPALWTYGLLIPLGVSIATYGTLIGAGGGILIVPALLLLYPHESANTIASISLAVIFSTRSQGRWPTAICIVSITVRASYLRALQCPQGCSGRILRASSRAGSSTSPLVR